MTSNAHPTPTDPIAPPGAIVVHTFARSDVGRTREHNEDAYVVADLETGEPVLFRSVLSQRGSGRGTLFMVADGMGGAAAGEIASEMAVEVVLQQMRRRWSTQPTADPLAFVAALKASTEAANATIHRYAADHPELRGMGTTATVAGLLGDTLYLAQVGDSRAYLVRDGVAMQITKDQSLMQKLIEAGEISVEEAEQSDRRNIILQALGPDSAVKIDLTHQAVRRGDVLILCSDGLSGLVRADVIAQAVREEPDLDAVCDRLIDSANDAGGPDNITVVAARFDGTGLPLPSEEDSIGHRVFGNLDTNTPTPVPAPALPERVPAVTAEPPAPRDAPLPDEDRRRRGVLYIRLLAGAGMLLTVVLLWEILTKL